MTHQFHIKKMRTSLEEKIQYQMKNHQDEWVNWNEWIGHEIAIEFQNEINCTLCNRKTKKAFGEGMCYPCFQNAPQAAPCIIRPELCEAHLGKGRDVEWEEQHHNQPHVVYLAKTSSIKVGITRSTQVPYRWIDQGAHEAVVIADVPYRRLAGEIEVYLKDHFTDKTNWQRMLKNEISEVDLLEKRDEIKSILPEELQQYFVEDAQPLVMPFPIEQHPLKVKSLKLDKMPVISGKLMGIRGQYLMFEDQTVMNVRAHSGYQVSVKKLG